MSEQAPQGRHTRATIRVLTVTISDTRSQQDDESGRLLCSLLSAAGFTLVEHRIVPDEPERVREIVREVADGDLADAIVTTGGTGIAPRDSTVEAIEPLLEKRLDGFGEAFRRLSWQEVGARSVLSRAIAGVARGRFIAALPGSPRAVRLAVEELLGPVLEHAVGLLRGETHHASAGGRSGA